MFFSRVLLLREQAFSSGNLPPERPKTTTTAIKTQLFRDALFRAAFKVKTLAVLFPPYPREMKTNTAKFKSAAILSLAFYYGNGATNSHARGLSMRTHLTAVEPLVRSNTGSSRFTDFLALCACSEASVTNLIGSGLNLLCLQSHSKPECRWTWPEVAILGADQRERGLWRREWN